MTIVVTMMVNMSIMTTIIANMRLVIVLLMICMMLEAMKPGRPPLPGIAPRSGFP
jgi:hypothetical protein